MYTKHSSDTLFMPALVAWHADSAQLAIRDGVKKTNSCEHVHKQDKMQNILKRKNMGRVSSYFEFFTSKSYFLDHSESIDMQIEKW